VRASLLTKMQPLYVRKGSDESRASNTTLANDSSLFLTVDANATYSMQSIIYYSTTSTADFKCRWTVPTGFMEWTGAGLGVGATGTSGDVYFNRLILSSTAQFGGADATNTPFMSLTIQGTLNVGGTGGLFRFQWAQITSNATATLVRGDSYIVLTRVA
jgi:hypothetical protein